MNTQTASVFLLALVCGAQAAQLKDAASDACYADNVFKAQFQALARAENAISATNAAHGSDANQGFFLNIINGVARANTLLLQLIGGDQSLVPKCLEINKNITFVVEQVIIHANDVVNGTQPFTGEALYQDQLQKLGQALVAIQNSVAGVAANAPCSKYQAANIKLVNDIPAIQAVIAANDNGAACISASTALAADLQVILGSLNDMSTDCSCPVVITTPMATAPPTTTYASTAAVTHAPTTAAPVPTTAAPVPTTAAPVPTTAAPTPGPTSAAPVSVTTQVAQVTTTMAAGGAYGK